MNYLNRLNLFIILLASVTVTIITYLVINKNSNTSLPAEFLEKPFTYNDDLIDFEGFDNVNGVDHNIVPNIVHLLYLQETDIKFFQMINIFSIYFNLKPDSIYIHCDKCDFKGMYYEKLKSYKELWDIVEIKKIPYKETIFGVKYGWINHHR